MTTTQHPVVAPDVTPSFARTLVPLVLDVVVPLSTYLLARDLVGLSAVGALVASSVVPVLRTAASALRERAVNGLSALMLAVNVAGIALSALSGSIRVVSAKDAVISSVIAIGLGLSALRGRPLMSTGLHAFVTKGQPQRVAAWERLSSGSPWFAAALRRYTLVWAACLFADCTVRLVLAAVAPVSILGWISTPVLIVTIVVAVIASGSAAAERIATAVDAAAEN